MASNQVQVIQYIVDTRKLWPQATTSKSLESHASRAMALLTAEERAAVLRFHFVADARLALASHLLKHWVVCRFAGVAWRAARLTRDANKKPVYVDPATGRQPVAFNVSHQAGLVALAAVAGYNGDEDGDGDGDRDGVGEGGGGTGRGGGGGGLVEIGTDVVCTSERRARDHRLIAAEGWASFVDMHADVFGRGETAYLKSDALLRGSGSTTTSSSDDNGGSSASTSSSSSGGRQLTSSAEVTDAKLRAFYTLWCLREAYVKMTGEALLASWLRDLNFRNFRAPAPGLAAALSPQQQQKQQQEQQQPREVVRDHDIEFRGRRLDDANICLRALGPDYMTCTALRTPRRSGDGLGWELGPFEFLSVDQIIADAEANLGE
ncbi:4'-phosphopantetheinyl transferase [Xylariaceae sp. FL0804]|nr:4'-phosphopantetheinyl transferase [Xylariaceae sp. FL0804]